MKDSKIEWCDHTVNFWWGCTFALLQDGSLSEECRNCYALLLSKLFSKGKAMKGLPFIPEMAVAALEGRKTQTRRIVKLPIIDKDVGCELSGGNLAASKRDTHRHCPYGKPGDRLCLLTTWAVNPTFDSSRPVEIGEMYDRSRVIRDDFKLWHAGMGTKPDGYGKSRPGRFLPNLLRPLMPVFKIVSVRVERLQAITEADALAEGVDQFADGAGFTVPGCAWTRDPIDAYRYLWNSLNEKRGYGWAANPWVWVIDFRRVMP